MPILLAMLVVGPAWAAQPGSWTVAATSGETHIRYGGGHWKPLKAGDTVGPHAEVITGKHGQVIFARGVSTITVSAGSRIVIPAPAASASPASLTPSGGRPFVERVIQSFGTMVYRVKPGKGNRFQVKTPYLVTTIKGTVFSVTVNTDGAAVHVSEGLVQVMPTNGIPGALVAAGQTASIGNGQGAGLELRGHNADKAPRVDQNGVVVSHGPSNPEAGGNGVGAVSLNEPSGSAGVDLPETPDLGGAPAIGAEVDAPMGIPADPGSNAPGAPGGTPGTAVSVFATVNNAANPSPGGPPAGTTGGKPDDDDLSSRGKP